MNKQSKKVSCIDIGSNAIKYRQYRLLQNSHLELDTFKRVSLRLGSDAFSSGKMTDESYLDFLSVLKIRSGGYIFHLLIGLVSSGISCYVANSGVQIPYDLNTLLPWEGDQISGSF